RLAHRCRRQDRPAPQRPVRGRRGRGEDDRLHAQARLQGPQRAPEPAMTHNPRHAQRKDPTMKREPAITVGTVSAAVAAVLTLLVAFGLDITEEQQTAILGVVATIGPLVAGLLIHRRVTPVSDE